MIERFLVILLCLSASSAAAQDASDLRALTSAGESRRFAAVGRLDFGVSSFCTGTLIAPRLVLTAAHCLFDRQTGVPHPPSDIRFRAGWRDGQAAAHRGARRVQPHPGYVPVGDQAMRVTNDVALVELDLPIRAADITAFGIAGTPETGSRIGVVSYAHDRAERPSLQERCHIIARDEGALVMDCDADFGTSGAPVLDLNGPTPRIVSVVSAKARLDARAVSLGMMLARPLAQTLEALSRSDAVVGHRLDTAGRPPTGAKFLRP